VPLYYELVHKLSASTSGLSLIAIVVMTTPGSISAARLVFVSPLQGARAHMPRGLRGTNS
jgi:hypothetical protein